MVCNPLESLLHEGELVMLSYFNTTVNVLLPYLYLPPYRTVEEVLFKMKHPISHEGGKVGPSSTKDLR